VIEVTRLNSKTKPDDEEQLVRRLYAYAALDFYFVEDDIICDRLTLNEGRNGLLHYWFMDATNCVAISEDGDIIDFTNNPAYFRQNFE
jgi:hypothetical protein